VEGEGGEVVVEEGPGEGAEESEGGVDEQDLAAETLDEGETAIEMILPGIADAIGFVGGGDVGGKVVGDFFDGGGETVVAELHLGADGFAQGIDEETAEGFELGSGEGRHIGSSRGVGVSPRGDSEGCVLSLMVGAKL
jgi:hypothetical protein